MHTYYRADVLSAQDHVQKNNDSLPSVVMALCLLLLDTSSKQGTFLTSLHSNADHKEIGGT
jgi:hypothetical protein